MYLEQFYIYTFLLLFSASPAAQAGVSSKWMPLSSANSSNTDKEDLGEMAKDVGSEKDVLRGAVGGAKSVDSGADNRQQVKGGHVDILIPLLLGTLFFYIIVNNDLK